MTMRYHNITTDDMLNGDGLRVVLWVAGCSHCCPGCQNPVTWDIRGGIPFDRAAREEIFRELDKEYISGITFSGGDPLHPSNRQEVAELIQEIPEKLRAGSHYESNIILLRSPFRITEEDLKTYGTIFKIGEVIGECDDEVWARPLADGQLDKEPSRIIVTDITTIDKARLGRRIGRLTPECLATVEKLLKNHLEL